MREMRVETEEAAAGLYSRVRTVGGRVAAPAVAAMWSIAPSEASAKTWGNLPAVQHIMSSVYEGGLLGVEAASEVESRYFAACALSRECRNLLRAMWFQMNAVKKGASRPADAAPSPKVQRLGVLGAGMMGAGIAHAAAKVGI